MQFTRTLAGELGPWNITANAYAPGMIPTAMNGFAELDAGRTGTPARHVVPAPLG